MGNVGDNSVSIYHLHSSETQQLSYVANATPICVELLGHSRQPIMGLTHLATPRLRYRLLGRIACMQCIDGCRLLLPMFRCLCVCLHAGHNISCAKRTELIEISFEV